MIEKTRGGMVRTWVGYWRWRCQVAKKQWYRDLQGNHHPQGFTQTPDWCRILERMEEQSTSQRCAVPPPHSDAQHRRLRSTLVLAG